jgi:hypothetical protein
MVLDQSLSVVLIQVDVLSMVVPGETFHSSSFWDVSIRGSPRSQGSAAKNSFMYQHYVGNGSQLLQEVLGNGFVRIKSDLCIIPVRQGDHRS